METVVTNLFKNKASNFGAFSTLTPKHVNMIYHQLSLVSSGALVAGKYDIRMLVGEDNTALESSADTGKTLTMTGVDSVVTSFTGAIRGIHLKVSTGLSAGDTISCVLASSTDPF